VASASAMSEKGEAAFSRTQPYDTSFKAFLDKVTLELLSFLLGEEIIFAQELKETLFKQESIKPPLRVDCAYLVHTRERQADGPFVLHLEEETAPNEEVEGRLAEYAIMLYRKYRLPIVQLLLCPFETKNLPEPPFQIKRGQEVRTWHHYEVVALWQREARERLERKQVRLYALLPTMKGITAELLIGSLREQRAFYADNESQLCEHLLWFDALLGRTTLLTAEDKRRVQYVMLNEFRGLLDEGYFVQLRHEEGRQEGLAEGIAKGREAGLEAGLVEGLQEALLTATELRFPGLLDLAQEQVKRVSKPEALRFALKGVKVAPSEESARLLLELIAA
jgi:predicted transposase YdaD